MRCARSKQGIPMLETSSSWLPRLKSWGGGEKDKADKQFDKFLRLVPKDHPYKEYFEDNMFPTKLFSQKLER